jgi:iron complex transport system substrate-binding protein
MRLNVVILTVVVVVSGFAAGGSGVAAASDSATLAQSDCAFPVSVTDTTGTEVTVEERPERVVVLQPSDAQAAWAVGAEDRVVGMQQTQYTAYLDGREGITDVVNDDLSVNVEQVVGLNPDIVLAANTTSVETVRQLRTAGITVYHFGLVTSLDEIETNLETTGALLGACDGAREASTEFRLGVERAERAAELAENNPRVLYYFFGTTTGTGTHIHDVLTTAGGTNVAAETGIEGYRQLSEEVVVDSDPEWIAYPGDATIPRTAAYNGTTALQRSQTIELQSNYISQPGPRVTQPLTRLAKEWHPDALDRANESITREDVRTATETVADTETPEATTAETDAAETTAASGPGLGAGVATAAIALAAVLGLARRR